MDGQYVPCNTVMSQAKEKRAAGQGLQIPQIPRQWAKINQQYGGQGHPRWSKSHPLLRCVPGCRANRDMALVKSVAE